MLKIAYIEQVVEIEHHMVHATFEGQSLYSGYHIGLDNGQHIYVLIAAYQDCCETWGYLASEDDLSYFVGENLYSVDVVDHATNGLMDIRWHYKKREIWVDEDHFPMAQFVDIVTAAGTLTLAVYNAHNGYYGHPIYVIYGDDMLLEKTL